MGTGYVRNDTGNNIAEGNVIDAADLDGEFDAIQDAFNSSTGHTHDGTAAEGGPITVTGPNQEYVSDATALFPKADDTYDLGKSTLKFKDGYFDGTLNADSITVTVGANFSGATISNLGTVTTADLNGGTIDNMVIGGTTSLAGSFTTLTASGTATFNGNTVIGNAATDTVTVTADVASNLIPSTDNAYDLGATGSEWRNLWIDGTANIDSLVADTADINGGTIDGVTIGGASAGAGTFTTLSADSLSGTAVQSSATDTTAGRLLTVGAFGLGIDAGQPITNIDTHNLSGIYFGYSSLHPSATPGTNPFPTGSGAFAMLAGNATLGTADQYLWQIAVEHMTVTPRVMVRANPGGTWGAWREIYNASSILGTVSQSGGVPTGAVIERGSNANGQYVRFADGTMICDVRLNSSSAGAVTWTFPSTFIAVPQVVGTSNQDLARFVTTSAGAVGSINFSLWNTSGARVDAAPVSLIAVGRWF